VFGNNVELRAILARDAVSRTFVAFVTMRGNLVEVVQSSVGVEGVDVDRIATAVQ